MVDQIKEKHCFVAFDLLEEKNKFNNKKKQLYRLPNNEQLSIAEEQFEAPELLFSFDRKFMVRDEPVHKLIADSGLACDEKVQRSLFENILLTGGTTQFNGFNDRLYKELIKVLPSNIKPEIIQNEEPNLAWVGGSLLANLNSEQSNWITREEYEEFGPMVVHRKGYM